MRLIAAGRKRITGQAGFTLVEFMVAFAISIMIAAGSMFLLYHIVTVSAENRDETMSTLQVQYVGFWISEDLVQAQEVELGDAQGFPIDAMWTEWDGDKNWVRYEIEGMEDEEELGLWQLKRTHWLNQGSGYESYGTTVVGKYLDPGLTRCYWNEEQDMLVLEVTAVVDRSIANSTYQIYPRALK